MPKPKVFAPAKPIVVTNDRKGVTLHLGDGRKLAFGESAEVTADVAESIKKARG